MKKSIKFLVLSICMAVLSALSFIIVGNATGCDKDICIIGIIIGYSILGIFFAFLSGAALIDYTNNKEEN